MGRQRRAEPEKNARGSGGFVTVGLVVTVAAAMVATIFGAGAASRILDVFDGNQWLWSSQKGEIARVNAPSGRVDIRQPFTDAQNHRVQISQDGKYLILRDLHTGKVTSLDLATLGISGSVKTKPGEGITVALAGDTAFIIDGPRGAITQVDPAALSTIGKPLTFPGGLKPGAVDTEGRLWVAVPGEGTVVAVTSGKDGATVDRTVDVTEPDHELALTVLDKGAAVIDQTAKTVFVVPADENADVAKVSVPDLDPAVQVPPRTSGQTIALTTPASRRVTVVRDDRATTFTVPGTGVNIGPAVAFADRIYVPDETAERVLVYDTAGKPLENIALPDANGPIEVEVRDAYLFINAPNSASARVVDAKHKITAVDKYPKDVVVAGASAKKSEQTQPQEDTKQSGQPNPGQSNPNGNGTTKPTKPQPKPQNPPSAPASAVAIAGNKAAQVTWTGALANGSPITAYVIEGGPRPIQVPARSRAVTVPGLDNGTDYTFTVHAVNGKGPGPKRTTNSVTPSADVPDAPTNVRAVADKDGSVQVNWDAADGQGTTVTGYTVKSKDADGAEKTHGATTSSSVRIDKAMLELGAEYTFTVVAHAGAKVSAASSPSAAVIPFSAPGQPANVSATSQPGQVTVKWGDAAANGRQISGFVVRVGTVEKQVAATARTLVVQVANSENYIVKVAAINEAGEGESGQAQVSTPNKPSVVDATATVTENSITVSAEVDAPSNGGTVKCSIRLGTQTKTGCRNVTFSSLKSATEYEYTVTATNGVGTSLPRKESATTGYNKVGGVVRCKNGSSGEEATYCNPGIARYTGPSQQNYSSVGKVPDGTRYTGECKAKGNRIIEAYIYNNYKTSDMWVRLTDGRYIPFVWFNLSNGDNINELATCR